MNRSLEKGKIKHKDALENLHRQLFVQSVGLRTMADSDALL